MMDDIYITGLDNIENGELKDENEVYKLIKIDTQLMIDQDENGEAKQVLNILLFCVHPEKKTNPSVMIFTPQNSVSLGIDDLDSDDNDDDDDANDEEE